MQRVGLLVVVLMACGGPGPGGQTTDPVQHNNPGGTTGGNSGGGCSSGDQCTAYSCSCNDGTFFNSAQYCLNAVCQGPDSTCSNACRDNGGVYVPSGGTGGGGSSGTTYDPPGSYCADASTCQAFSCQCSDGRTIDSAQYCLNNVCQGGQATCDDACSRN